jgi:hypothetical protein
LQSRHHTGLLFCGFTTRTDAAVPTEIPEPPDLEKIRMQIALMLVASFSGYVHWPAFYLLLLGLAWMSLEIERRIALGIGLRSDLSYWTSVVWTPFEAGRLLSLMIGYLQG